jgi:hypothetical protein
VIKIFSSATRNRIPLYNILYFINQLQDKKNYVKRKKNKNNKTFKILLKIPWLKIKFQRKVGRGVGTDKTDIRLGKLIASNFVKCIYHNELSVIGVTDNKGNTLGTGTVRASNAL